MNIPPPPPPPFQSPPPRRPPTINPNTWPILIGVFLVLIVAVGLALAFGLI
jgi:hypothetical protein